VSIAKAIVPERNTESVLVRNVPKTGLAVDSLIKAYGRRPF
jgi:hypothetical protein